MKKITKLALVLAASVVAGAFTGCADKAGEDADSLKFGEEFSLTNNSSTGYARNYKTTRTKHTSAVAEVTLPPVISGTRAEKDPAENGDGVVGMIFHVQENEDKSQTFGLAGLRRKLSGTVEYYVSYYKNVNVDSSDNGYLNKKDDFCDMDGKKIGESGSNASDVGPEKALTALGLTADEGKDCKIYIYMVAGGPDKNGDGVVKSGEGDGSYIISFYKEADWDVTKKKPKEGKTPLAKKTVTNTMTGDTKATEYKLGMYLNAYLNRTLKGKFDLIDTVNECEIEFED